MQLCSWFFIIMLWAQPGYALTSDTEEFFRDWQQLIQKTYNEKIYQDLKIDEWRQAFEKNFKGEEIEEAIRLNLQKIGRQLELPDQALLNDQQPLFWAYRAAEGKAAPTPQLGAWVERKGQHWFVSYVFKQTPAAKMGLKRGDEILTINDAPFHPIKSFQTQSAKTWNITYLRDAHGSPIKGSFQPLMATWEQLMVQDITNSRLVFKYQDRYVGYVRLWTVHSDAALTALSEVLREMDGKVDVLIVDTRDGLSYRSPGLLSLFLPRQDGERTVKALFNKPVIALVNNGTSGSREWLVGMLRNEQRAILVGQTTAGEFYTNDHIWFHNDRWLLRRPLADKSTLPGFKQQTGLTPDIATDSGLVFSAGNDPAWQAALSAVTRFDKRS